MPYSRNSTTQDLLMQYPRLKESRGSLCLLSRSTSARRHAQGIERLMGFSFQIPLMQYARLNKFRGSLDYSFCQIGCITSNQTNKRSGECSWQFYLTIIERPLPNASACLWATSRTRMIQYTASNRRLKYSRRQFETAELVVCLLAMTFYQNHCIRWISCMEVSWFDMVWNDWWTSNIVAMLHYLLFHGMLACNLLWSIDSSFVYGRNTAWCV